MIDSILLSHLHPVNVRLDDLEILVCLERELAAAAILADPCICSRNLPLRNEYILIYSDDLIE